MPNSITYYDIAVGALENAEATSSYQMTGSDAEDILTGATPINYVSFEGAGLNLDDSTYKFVESGDTLCYISSSTSNNNQTFTTNPSIVITLSGGYYSGIGLTLFFWQNYCSAVNVSYYSDNTLITSDDYSIDSLSPFLAQEVELYNKIVITFKRTQFPNSRAKLHKIAFGKEKELVEFIDINLLEEINLNSDDLPIDTLDFTVMSEDELSFQKQQKLELYHNGEIMGTFCVVSSTRSSEMTYEVSCESFIGNLETSIFLGLAGIGASVRAWLYYIKNSVNVPIELDDYYYYSNIEGYIPKGTSRNALMLLAWGLGAFVTTSRDGVIKIVKLRDQVVSRIDGSRILDDSTYEKNNMVTQVNFVKHSCNLDASAVLEKLFEGTANDSTIYFKKPYYILNYDADEIDVHDWGFYWMRLSGTGVVEGKPFLIAQENYEKRNPRVTANISENIIEYKDYTIISTNHLHSFGPTGKLNQLYDNAMSKGKINARIILENEKVGDVVEIETRYNGTKYGTIISLDIDVGDSALIANAVIQEWGENVPINLIKIPDLFQGYIQTTSPPYGAEVESPTHVTTGIINVEEGKSYTINSTNFTMTKVCSYIDGVYDASFSPDTNETVTIPAGVSAIRICIQRSDYSQISVDDMYGIGIYEDD